MKFLYCLPTDFYEWFNVTTFVSRKIKQIEPVYNVFWKILIINCSEVGKRGLKQKKSMLKKLVAI